MSGCYCLIPDGCGNRVLVVSAGDGRWTLPSLENQEPWFAYASTAIARSASGLYAIPMTALREHSVGDCRVCELEIQSQHWTPPVGTRWIACSDLAEMALEPAGLSIFLRAWFAGQEPGAIPAIRPPWERRGWYAEAVRWILSQCERLGHAPSGPVEQLKAAWSLSTILRVPTSVGALYFKAAYAKPPSELAIIDTLARRWPRNIPVVIASDVDRGWMLMRDFGERSLDHEPIARWQAANRRFSAIQLACSADLTPWWRLRCPDRRIPVLVACMDRMFCDPTATRIDEPGGLTSVAMAQLRKLMPRLHDMWGELATIPIPASLVQQDFRHGNIALSETGYVFYDWSDTVVGHPFFACCRFLDYLPNGPGSRRGLPVEERRRRIAVSYLQPWTRIVGHDDLWRAFELVRQLNPIYVAIRRHLETPYCEPTSSWGRAMREGPAVELRRLLASMDEIALVT
jgi:hypothetical protein